MATNEAADTLAVAKAPGVDDTSFIILLLVALVNDPLTTLATNNDVPPLLK